MHAAKSARSKPNPTDPDAAAVRPGAAADAHRRRCAPLTGAHLLDHGPQHPAHERLGGVRRAAEQDRGGVTQAALELLGEAGRVVEPASEGGLAHEDLSVFTDVGHGGDGVGVASEGDG